MYEHMYVCLSPNTVRV